MKPLLIAFGFLFLAIGIVGIFVPLLPTTPFLLLTAICFERGSERFHRWLVQHRVFGPPIRDWKQHQAIRPKYKVLASAMMAGSAWFIFQNERIPLMGKAVFTASVLSVSVFLWTRNSKS